MNILDAVAAHLVDNGIGTLGTTLYLGELPFDKSEVISLVQSPSPEPNKSIPYYTQVIDVWVRYSDYDDGYQKLQSIFDLIHQAENYQLDDNHIYLSYALGMINDNGRDTERRHLFSLSLGFVYRKVSEFS